MDIATTFPLLKPLFSGFSSHSAALVSGYGGLRTFVESDPPMGKVTALLTHIFAKVADLCVK
jgi:hypothetical protein